MSHLHTRLACAVLASSRWCCWPCRWSSSPTPRTSRPRTWCGFICGVLRPWQLGALHECKRPTRRHDDEPRVCFPVWAPPPQGTADQLIQRFGSYITGEAPSSRQQHRAPWPHRSAGAQRAARSRLLWVHPRRLPQARTLTPTPSSARVSSGEVSRRPRPKRAQRVDRGWSAWWRLIRCATPRARTRRRQP